MSGCGTLLAISGDESGAGVDGGSAAPTRDDAGNLVLGDGAIVGPDGEILGGGPTDGPLDSSTVFDAASQCSKASPCGGGELFQNSFDTLMPDAYWRNSTPAPTFDTSDFISAPKSLLSVTPPAGPAASGREVYRFMTPQPAKACAEICTKLDVTGAFGAAPGDRVVVLQLDDTGAGSGDAPREGRARC